MKAAVVTALGHAPQYREVPEPQPVDGQQVACVRAAALKNIERQLVSGEHYGSGQLEVPGLVGVDAVVQLADGRRAYTGAAPPSGTMAERLAIDPRRVVEVPEAVDDAAAAALPNAGVSAWLALEFAARVQPGQTVLVLGGTGVTGALAAQLAKHQFGAGRVVVAGRNERRLAWLRAHGADEAVRLDTNGASDAIGCLHASQPFDVVLDYVWGRPAEQTLQALANDDLAAPFHRTRYVQVGEMAGRTIELPAAVLRSAGIELVGQGGGSIPREVFTRIGTDVIPTLFGLLADGKIAVETVTRPLADIARVWAEPARSGERIVLVP